MPDHLNTDEASTTPCFTFFKEPIASYALPEKFTFPFYYQPHPLCLLAASELQAYLKTQKDWQRAFGLTTGQTTDTENNQQNTVGKMFGVLLVQNKKGEIGYLSAFSGILANSNHHSKFVPPVFDVLDKNGFYPQGQIQVSQLTTQIENLKKSPQLIELSASLKTLNEAAETEIETQRQLVIEKKKQRKIKRSHAETELNKGDFEKLKETLGKESVYEKNYLKYLKIIWQEKTKETDKQYTKLTTEILELKNKRKKLSSQLQRHIFDQYQFLNQQRQSKSLFDIFDNTMQKTPPAAAGECAAPKLLQYAFMQQMKPLAMAEFWWGESPKSEIRKHLHFYPACRGKCKPILAHMLEGIKMDDNPLLQNPAKSKSFDIIYEDKDILIINKPTGLLSVPGKDIEDSVYQRIKNSYPSASGPLIVHRLDMCTSGLLIIALNAISHKKLQQQFIKRTVKKRYIALLDDLLTEDNGLIDLPLRVDLDDRPRQLVCYEYGKNAQTEWQVIERKNGKTRVHFHPITGRTHQLRVHAAHNQGLDTPIVGDDLYGDKANRLHLHAETIEFTHPTTKELMKFKVDAEF